MRPGSFQARPVSRLDIRHTKELAGNLPVAHQLRLDKCIRVSKQAAPHQGACPSVIDLTLYCVLSVSVCVDHFVKALTGLRVVHDEPAPDRVFVTRGLPSRSAWAVLSTQVHARIHVRDLKTVSRASTVCYLTTGVESRTPVESRPAVRITSSISAALSGHLRFAEGLGQVAIHA